MNRIFRFAAFALTALLSTSALAQPYSLPLPGANPVPMTQGMYVDGQAVVLSDAAFLSAKTVAVQPVVLSGAGDWFALATRMAIAKPAPAAVAAAGAALATLGHQTLGFAGEATTGDRAMLRAALHVGALESARALGDTRAAGRLALAVARDKALFASLSPRALAAVHKSVSETQAVGAVDVALRMGDLLTAATRVQKDPRRHGYLAAGAWAGAAILVASMGGDAGYAMLAEPLAQELDKDAAFGALDRKVATALRGIATELQRKRPSVAKVQELVGTLVGLSMT